MAESRREKRRERRSEARLERPPLNLEHEWRTLAWALLRGLLTAAGLILLYAAVPLDGKLSGHGALALAIGLIVFAAAATWQVRAILAARYPVLQAIEALAVVIPLFLLTFAAIYVGLQHSNSHSFSQHMDKVGAIYFTVTVFATVGFGDITPVTQTARLVVTFQMLADLVVLGVLLRVIIGAVQMTRQHRAGTSAEPAGNAPQVPAMAPSSDAPSSVSDKS